MFLLDEEEVIIDEESMREEFEQKMEFLLQMKLFSEEELKKWFSQEVEIGRRIEKPDWVDENNKLIDKNELKHHTNEQYYF